MGVKKKRPLAVLRDRGGNGRCPLGVTKAKWPIGRVFEELLFFMGEVEFCS